MVLRHPKTKREFKLKKNDPREPHLKRAGFVEIDAKTLAAEKKAAAEAKAQAEAEKKTAAEAKAKAEAEEKARLEAEGKGDGNEGNES